MKNQNSRARGCTRLFNDKSDEKYHRLMEHTGPSKRLDFIESARVRALARSLSRYIDNLLIGDIRG